ncbi:organic cation transporter protein-like [Amphiura filiformis]|uniref:organic cation transporter protein-like n=1 Tax=Amphiura filiformis TaxID=82378 RepID=UPI003B21F139
MAGVACVVTIFVPPGTARTSVAMLGKFATTIAFAIVYIFTVEQYPTSVRNVALGFCATFGRIGSIVAPLVLLMGDYYAALPYFVCGICSTSSGIMALFLSETMGTQLPENIDDDENEDNEKDLDSGQVNNDDETNTTDVESESN